MESLPKLVIRTQIINKRAVFYQNCLNASADANEQYLKNILAYVGPVVISMWVQASSFQGYKGGVYYDTTCPNACEKVNHGMLLVGYGTDTTTFTVPVDYWLIKNR